MADVEAKPPVASEEKPGSSAVETWRPFESLRREVDRLFEEFDRGLRRFWREHSMADVEAKPRVASEEKPETWRPLEGLRGEVDRLFEEFERGLWRFPRALSALEPAWLRGAAPAVEIVERDKDYLVSAELPGLSDKDVELKLANDVLTIRGEKKEEKEEKRKGYYLSERRYGAFERSFRVPEGADSDKVEAKFSKGVLTIAMPKKPEAMKAARTIDIKPGG